MYEKSEAARQARANAKPVNEADAAAQAKANAAQDRINAPVNVYPKPQVDEAGAADAAIKKMKTERHAANEAVTKANAAAAAANANAKK